MRFKSQTENKGSSSPLWWTQSREMLRLTENSWMTGWKEVLVAVCLFLCADTIFPSRFLFFRLWKPAGIQEGRWLLPPLQEGGRKYMVSSKFCVYVLVKPRELKIVEKAMKTQPAMIQVDKASDVVARQHRLPTGSEASELQLTQTHKYIGRYTVCVYHSFPEWADENNEHRKNKYKKKKIHLLSSSCGNWNHGGRGRVSQS